MKKSVKFNVLVSKILFIELGFMSLLVSALVLFNNPINELTPNLICGVFFILGMACFYPCFIKDDSKVINWAENTGNHEIMTVFVAIAYGISSLLKRRG